jgi:hypothetical protein
MFMVLQVILCPPSAAVDTLVQFLLTCVVSQVMRHGYLCSWSISVPCAAFTAWEALVHNLATHCPAQLTK